jgi:hypothetical protein
MQHEFNLDSMGAAMPCHPLTLPCPLQPIDDPGDGFTFTTEAQRPRRGDGGRSSKDQPRKHSGPEKLQNPSSKQAVRPPSFAFVRLFVGGDRVRQMADGQRSDIGWECSAGRRTQQPILLRQGFGGQVVALLKTGRLAAFALVCPHCGKKNLPAEYAEGKQPLPRKGTKGTKRGPFARLRSPFCGGWSGELSGAGPSCPLGYFVPLLFKLHRRRGLRGFAGTNGGRNDPTPPLDTWGFIAMLSRSVGRNVPSIINALWRRRGN